MKAALEKELSALTLEEKNEVMTFLMPFVTPPENEEVSLELLEVLDRRLEEDDSNPQAAMTLDEFKGRWAHRG